MEYLYNYLMFLAQAVTIVVALVVIISSIASLGQKPGVPEDAGMLLVIKLNDRLRDLRHAMEASLLPPDALKKQLKVEEKQRAQKEKEKTKAKLAEQKQAEKQVQKASTNTKTTTDVATTEEAQDKPANTDGSAQTDGDAGEGRVFVLRFDGDTRASNGEQLRLEVSAILTMATPADEVVVVLESPGGMVHSYGLAASQLTRIRQHKIPLTAVVDKVAASGGYLMAAVANKVLAAPFALVGSIGVVAQVPNVYRLLKKNDVDVEVLTAGKFKRTLTMFGENTDEGREKFVEELEDVHALFQEFVAENRPGLDLERVATGEAWYGKRALELNLVDELVTSDEYLMHACENKEVFEVRWVEQKKPIDRFLGRVNGVLDQASSLLEMWRR